MTQSQWQCDSDLSKRWRRKPVAVAGLAVQYQRHRMHNQTCPAALGSKEIHVVYASPDTVAAYRKDGRFPDGSVLVKEVFEATTAAMTTGTVSRAQKLQGWFVMVKDSKNSHPGNRLWGEGWGWSWFDAANPVKTTSKDFRNDCLGCHIPAKATDWIYVSGYPGLKK
jgi:hypothetical protein